MFREADSTRVKAYAHRLWSTIQGWHATINRSPAKANECQLNADQQLHEIPWISTTDPSTRCKQRRTSNVSSTTIPSSHRRSVAHPEGRLSDHFSAFLLPYIRHLVKMCCFKNGQTLSDMLCPWREMSQLQFRSLFHTELKPSD